MQYVPVNSDDTEPALAVPRASVHPLFSGKLLESFELVEVSDQSASAVVTLSFFEEGLVVFVV
jgi:hypothetical protein